MVEADVVIWSMADKRGRCPGDAGPCMHFRYIEDHDAYQDADNEPLMKVVKAYNDFVKACEGVAADRNAKKLDDRTYKVALMMTDEKPRFGFTYSEGAHAHRPVKGDLMKAAGKALDHVRQETPSQTPPRIH